MKRKPYKVHAVKKRSRRRWIDILLWSLVGCLVVVACVGVGYYLWLDSKVAAANARVPDDVYEALADDPTTTLGPSTTLSPTSTTEPPPESPDAMNILLVGADRRLATSKVNGLSDTLILLHVDPGNNYMSMLSFPRDLRVDIEGYGKKKLNTAYSYGGPALSIRTIQDLTGVDIDHYLGVDFTAFRDITDSLGGVYLEVDRRYYYSGWRYANIDLQPGYRLLDGRDALDYVRFRHDSNLDFGRMERQQRFLSAVRQQAMGWDLGLKLPGIISAFFDNVTTDLGTNDIIKLAWWGIRLDGSRLRQITLRGTTQTIGGGSYVIVSDEKIAAAVQELLTPPGGESTADTTGSGSDPDGTGSGSTDTTAWAADSLGGVQVDILNATAPSGSATAAGEWFRSLGATVLTVGNSSQKLSSTQVLYPAGLAASAQKVAAIAKTAQVTLSTTVERVTLILGGDFTPPPGFATAATIPDWAAWKYVAGKVEFPVQAPGYIPDQYVISKRSPNNATIYKIDTGGDSRPILVMLYKLRGRDQYMNVTQTTWLDAPLASPGREVTHNGRVLTVVYLADQVERVWWKSDGVLYWVSNTISRMASEEELLAIARSMVPVPVQ